MSRRALLWLLGLTTVVLLVLLLGPERRMQETGGPGIVGFEVAGSEERAREILGQWGEAGRDAARTSLWLDFPYLIAYGAFLALAAAAIRDLARQRRWRRFTSVGYVMVPFALTGAGLDALENIGLLITLAGSGGDWAPRLATVFAIGKFALISAVIAYVVVGLVRRAYQRTTRTRDG